MKKIVHVVGTGTIGEPLLGLFEDFRDKMGIDEVTFHKRTPLASDRAKLNHLIQRGAKLAVDEDVRSEFEKLGHTVTYESREALERATVIVDCTPLLTVSHAMVVSSRADALVVITRADRVTPEISWNLQETLKAVPAMALGVVVTATKVVATAGGTATTGAGGVAGSVAEEDVDG